MTTSSRVDHANIKALARSQWDEAAAGWNAHHPAIRVWLSDVTATMLDAARIRSGAHVLDVAAGAGDQTLDIAKRVGPAGSVVATDISPRILELARWNAHGAGYANVETHLADGEELSLPRSFDAAVCRLGLMFYPDPARGLAQMFSALREGGWASTVVFSDAADNPCVVTALRIALKHANLKDSRPGGLLQLGQTWVHPGAVRESRLSRRYDDQDLRSDAARDDRALPTVSPGIGWPVHAADGSAG